MQLLSFRHPIAKDLIFITPVVISSLDLAGLRILEFKDLV